MKGTPQPTRPIEEVMEESRNNFMTKEVIEESRNVILPKEMEEEFVEEKINSLHERMIALISKDYMRIYKKESEGKSEKEKLYLRLMLVTDYICGMTDSFAKDLYQELNGIV